ncbi:MAG: type II secretion system protein [Motilibacteraceae bacterium]
MQRRETSTGSKRSLATVGVYRPARQFSWSGRRSAGFTIVELLIVIVVIGILVAITIVAYNGVQARARDSARIDKIKSIAQAIELYKVDNGQYPPILDDQGVETTCGSQTENWGHCDRNKQLADMLAPYIKIDPTSLSDATQGNYWYWYTSQSSDNYQTYGLMVYLEGNGGQDDGGYFANAYEVGPKPRYCMAKYAGSAANWTSYTNQCAGGD